METYYNPYVDVTDAPSSEWIAYYLAGCYWVATKSKDLNTKVGAILTKNNRIVSTGYNGLPAGLDDTLEERQNYPFPECLEKNKEKNYYSEHAEKNAIFSAAKTGISTNNSILYINIFPCPDCTRGIIQAGVNIVVVHKYFNDIIYNNNLMFHKKHNKSKKWIDALVLSRKMLIEAGISIIEYPNTLKCIGFFNGKHWKI